MDLNDAATSQSNGPKEILASPTSIESERSSGDSGYHARLLPFS
jgi:hypothetical protein